MKILSLVLCLMSLALMIIASLIKGEKIGKTLVLVCVANALVIASYTIEGGMSGAGASVIGALISVINYFFESKEKPIPMWLNIYAHLLRLRQLREESQSLQCLL